MQQLLRLGVRQQSVHHFSYHCVVECCLKILIYGLNYAPELTGVGKYTGEMASWLALRGHEVRVVTAPPYYPAWHVDDAYRRPFYRKESAEGKHSLRVYRCPLWVPARPGGITRMLHLSSFALSSLPVMAFQTLWKPEIVFTVEPTFFAAPIALLAAALSGAASWLHIQDFEVDAAFRLGLLPANGPVHALATRLETIFTGRFSRVSSISQRMVDRSKARGASRSGTVLFPNWGDVEAVRPADPGTENSFRRDYGLEGKTVLLYSGNMGAKQGLEVLAPLAQAFSGNPHVHFLFCGDGSFRPKLERLVRDQPNVTMLPLQPNDKLNDLLNAADIHLLPQRREAADLVLPSKLGGILCSGRPVIAIAEKGSQVADIVSGCGLVVSADDAVALIAAAVRLVNDVELRKDLGHAAREYAVKHLSKERVLRRFEQDMLELVRPPDARKKIALVRTYRA